GTFSNFVGRTLTGGTYFVSGTFKFTNADIQTNAAAIVLDGPASAIVNQNNVNALANFTTNSANGDFTIQNGRDFTTGGTFQNAGSVTVGPGSTFHAAGSYTQISGVTTLNDSSLAATGTVDLQGGVLTGSGTIAADVRNAAVLEVGLAGSAGYLVVSGNYVQTAAGTLNMEIGGLAPGSDYDVLSVQGTATLDGTLNLSLLNGYVPNPDDVFALLTSNGLSGDFATINGLDFGGGAFSPFH